LNRLVEGIPTSICKPGITVRIFACAEVVTVVVLKRAFECFILHYNALAGWLRFYAGNWSNKPASEKEMGEAFLYSVREDGTQGKFVPS
jgi:hypothetical protein